MTSSQLHTTRRVLQILGALSMLGVAWSLRGDGEPPLPLIIVMVIIAIGWIIVAKMIERVDYTDVSAPPVNIEIPDDIAARNRNREDPPA